MRHMMTHNNKTTTGQQQRGRSPITFRCSNFQVATARGNTYKCRSGNSGYVQLFVLRGKDIICRSKEHYNTTTHHTPRATEESTVTARSTSILAPGPDLNPTMASGPDPTADWQGLKAQHRDTHRHGGGQPRAHRDR